MRGEFLQWSGEHGGFGCRGPAFEAGWNAALNTVVTPNTSTNTGSPKLLDELHGLIVSGNIRDVQWFKRGMEIIEQLRAGA
jgi:hypothetical protein